MSIQMNSDRKIGKEEWCIMGVFFMILLFLQPFIETGWGDDTWFAANSIPMPEFLRIRYMGWTSRILIEAGILLLSASEWIWRILNILIILVLIWIVSDLFGIEENNSMMQARTFFFVLIWAVPILCIKETGWIATTMNYLWPMTMGLVAARPIKHWIKGERCSAWEYAVCPLCMLYGSNVEQGAALLWGGTCWPAFI